MSSSQFPPPLSYSSGQGAIGPSSIHSPPAVLSPDSTNSIYASPDSGHQPFYLAKSEPDDGASTGSSAAAGPLLPEPLKKKQKRNKPTLSCHECVERKTKVSTSPYIYFPFSLSSLCHCSPLVFLFFGVYFIFSFYPYRPAELPKRSAPHNCILPMLGFKQSTAHSSSWLLVGRVLRQYDVVLMQAPIAREGFRPSKGL